MIYELREDLRKVADPKRVKILQGFFKTKKGEYGFGDMFIGIPVPLSRIIAKKYRTLSFAEIEALLQSRIHEERLIALIILIDQFQKGNEKVKKEIFNFYLSQTSHINNWDLVDVSADKIVGEYLLDRSKDLLYTLARSENVWEKRIAMIATFSFILQGEYRETFRIAEILLQEKHDLIQKAVGWMLREVGKRCSQKAEEEFLKKHYKTMPRTSLRYAIERFPQQRRKAYLAGNA